MGAAAQEGALLWRSGFEPRAIFRPEDSGTVQALVAAGMGVALVPYLATQPADPQIAVVELGGEVPARRLAWSDIVIGISRLQHTLSCTRWHRSAESSIGRWLRNPLSEENRPLSPTAQFSLSRRQP